MTTQEVANKYYELASLSKWIEIQDEFYDENVVSLEPEHVAARGIEIIAKGKEAIKAKGKAFREMIDTIHHQDRSEPIVAGNFFSLSLKRDITFKNMPRIHQEEIGLFQVKDGKIVSEQFFY